MEIQPKYYRPAIKKIYKYGFIPHYVDQQIVEEWYGNEDHVTVLNLIHDDVLFTTDRILECEHVISSSLHGVIVAQAYGIPAIWVQFSNKLSGDNVKYEDYFLSVGIKPYQPIYVDKKRTLKEYEAVFSMVETLPSEMRIKKVQNALIQAFPREHL